MLRKSQRAFSIAELLVVLGGFGLLTTFVAPLPQRLQQQRRLTGCLGNLGRIGAASLAYANQDARQQVIPMHAADVTNLCQKSGGFLGTAYGWRTAAMHMSGGQSATTAFVIDGWPCEVMLDEHWGLHGHGASANPWGAATRPLNSFVGGDFQTFHCPADSGYPALAASSEVPPGSVGIPCFDLLGNSYRRTDCGLVWGPGGGTPSGESGGFPAIVARMTTSPFGHKAEHLLEPSRTIMYSDPSFYSLVRRLAAGDPVDPVVGWHGVPLADNVVYSDGSARLTEIGTLQQFSSQELQRLFLQHEDLANAFLRRGPSWQMDCYPAPGALTRLFEWDRHHCQFTDSHESALSGMGGWPFRGCVRNGNPFPYEPPDQGESATPRP